MQSHANARHWSSSAKQMIAEYQGPSAFENLLAELHKTPLKYLQQLLTDLNKNGAIHPFYGDYHRMLVGSLESFILERTMLK